MRLLWVTGLLEVHCIAGQLQGHSHVYEATLGGGWGPNGTGSKLAFPKRTVAYSYVLLTHVVTLCAHTQGWSSAYVSVCLSSVSKKDPGIGEGVYRLCAQCKQSINNQHNLALSVPDTSQFCCFTVISLLTPPHCSWPVTLHVSTMGAPCAKSRQMAHGINIPRMDSGYDIRHLCKLTCCLELRDRMLSFCVFPCTSLTQTDKILVT